ncbi:MAG: DegT/DnrJ/EryC1/StrS family aminotransferase [Actinobacteria bacterium]|nr:DegT/DnrJ/EryC1/StrS family aminotransferase [Actinomycetota bacterium]
MRVPFNDLGRHMKSVGNKLDAAIASVTSSGWFINGPQVEAFEAEFSAYCGTRHCIGVGNGTDALEIALRAVGCAPGDEVITVANAGMYTSAACLLVGANPVYAEIDPATLELDPTTLPALLSKRTKAIVITHLYGGLVDVDAVLKVVRTHPSRIAVLEDCAQAHGAGPQGRRAGSLGDLAAFSFYPTKNLGALGDAGAITTSDDNIADRVRALSQYGWRSKYEAVIPSGRNSRLDEIQAAVLRVKLPYLDTWNQRRREILAAYQEAAAGTRLKLIHRPTDNHGAHLCIAVHPQRHQLQDSLATQGVETAIHYPIPDHMQPALANTAWRSNGLTLTEKAANEVLSLPCFPELTADEISYVCRLIASAN